MGRLGVAAVLMLAGGNGLFVLWVWANIGDLMQRVKALESGLLKPEEKEFAEWGT